jgi:hypothetical protein
VQTSLRRLAWVNVLTLLALAAPALAAPLRFFALGDTPYSEGEFLQLEGLLGEAAEARPAFVIHVGDIKSGTSICTDAYTARIAALFRSLPVPVAYTPGDNEWTDCWRAGGDPMERLAGLRRDFYADPAVLRLGELGAVHPDPAYPENYYFLSRGALFVAVHVVGSKNGLERKEPDATAEWKARSAANRTLLKKAVAAAKADGAGALVVFFQADPLFEAPAAANGFAPLLVDLGWLSQAFAGPILVIHGDHHRYVLDQPLRDPQTGRPEPRLTRLQVPGSPLVAGVWITYDPSASEPFRFDRTYPDLVPDPIGP